MDSDVQQIKDRVNIVDIVGQYVTLRRAGRTYSGKCPFHKERTPSFHVSPERGTYKCFGCGEGGDVFSFLQKMDGTDFPTVLKQLAEKAGIKLTPRSGAHAATPEQKEHDERLHEVCEAAVAFFEQKLKERKDVQEYLKTRGVHDETVTAWRLGYAPASWDQLTTHLKSVGFSTDDIVDAGFALKSERKPGAGAERQNERSFDRFRGRIMFPIFDMQARPIAVSGRFFEKVPGAKSDDEPAKYVNSPETALFKKSRVLYGLDRARTHIRKLDCILLVEGQFDLILSHQSGLPFAVALSGTALTPEHLAILGKLSKRLVLALDADAAGLRSGLKSAHMALVAGFDVKVPVFPNGKDPADLARENPELLKAAIRTSKTAVEFFLDALRPGAKDSRAYAKLVEAQVLPLIAAVHSSIEQDQYVRLVAGRLGVSESAVRMELEKAKVRTSDVLGASDVQPESTEPALTPLEKKVGMLLFGRSSSKDKLQELLGAEYIVELERRLGPFAEDLRFRFDAEVGEHSSDEQITGDMLASIESAVAKERFKMKFL